MSYSFIARSPQFCLYQFATDGLLTKLQYTTYLQTTKPIMLGDCSQEPHNRMCASKPYLPTTVLYRTGQTTAAQGSGSSTNPI